MGVPLLQPLSTHIPALCPSSFGPLLSSQSCESAASALLLPAATWYHLDPGRAEQSRAEQSRAAQTRGWFSKGPSLVAVLCCAVQPIVWLMLCAPYQYPSADMSATACAGQRGRTEQNRTEQCTSEKQQRRATERSKQAGSTQAGRQSLAVASGGAVELQQCVSLTWVEDESKA